MYFGVSQNRLLQRVRDMIHNGELTERGLARATGVSQPHVHNMLKGARAFSPEFADQLLHYLGMSLADLLHDPQDFQSYNGLEAFQPVPVLRGCIGAHQFPFNPERHERVHPFPRAQVAGLTDPVAVTIGDNEFMAPQIQQGDLVLLDRSEYIRLHPPPTSLCVVSTPAGTAVRFLRVGGRSLYLLTQDSVREPEHWDYLSLAGQNMLEVVRGRIVWIGRALEENAPEQARKAG